MRQFENNKLQDGFENKWSRRLVEGGDGYMFRNLNNVTANNYFKGYKMTYFSYANFWN